MSNPSTPLPVVIRQMTPELIPLVLQLEVSPEQAMFVASNAASLDDWKDDPDFEPLAICVGDDVVGFAMFEASPDDDGTIEFNIFRLMIDRHHQGRGYGRRAMEALISMFSADPRPSRITTCFVPTNTEARRMYARLGFVEIDVDDDGEIIAQLRRNTPTDRGQDEIATAR